MSELPKRKCLGCGREILFARSTGSGKILPLERVNTYWVEEIGGQFQATKDDAGDHYISHFLTCKDRDRFSGSKGGGRHGIV